MEAKNFRIGNLVESGKGIYKIFAMSIPQIIAIQNYDESMDSQLNVYPSDNTIIKPIYLTEDWLKNFGFTKVGSNYEKGWLLLHTNNKTGTVDFLLNEPSTGKYKATVLKYVHQLQNLFFAITGEELELVHERSTCG